MNNPTYILKKYLGAYVESSLFLPILFPPPKLNTNILF
jgi:hypothetical protein